jgi:hypothetical protein
VAIADAIERADNSRIKHFLLWSDALQEGQNETVLRVLARALLQCPAILRQISPDRGQDYPKMCTSV